MGPLLCILCQLFLGKAEFLLGAVARAEVLWAALGLQLARLFHVVIDLKRIQDCLIHVEVLVRCEAPHEAHGALLLCELAVALIQCAVLRVGHWVVGVALGRGVFACDEGALDLAAFDRLGLVWHVFVLNNAREGDLW